LTAIGQKEETNMACIVMDWTLNRWLGAILLAGFGLAALIFTVKIAGALVGLVLIGSALALRPWRHQLRVSQS
jgi:hypothetical protein